MNSSKLKENVCRICLKHKVNVNWNDEILEFCGLSYKDCYYKYTKLDEKDADYYPTTLCKKCAGALKNAHLLFERALESFKILQDIDTKYFGIDSEVKSESQDSNAFIVDDKTLVQMKENRNVFDLHTNGTNADPENETKASNKIEVTIVDPTHFVDIQNFESSVEIPFEDQFEELDLPKKPRSKRKRMDTNLSISSERQNETSDIQPLDSKKMRNGRKCDTLSLCKGTNDDCKNIDNKTREFGPNDKTSLENIETKPAKRSRKKYLLMCSYCSLVVDGAKKLEKHEATHNENRERTEVCSECGLKFYTDWALILHMRIHDKNRQREHKCEFCEKAFFNKGALNVHRRIHLGLMIKCQICEKDFFRQVDLDKHLLKHSASPLEKNVGKKQYFAQCQYCNKSILTIKLKEHIAVHLNQPQVKCKICDKNFYSRTKCTNHLRRFHLKNVREYEDFIHYYVDRNKRLSSLMIKQQLAVQPLK